MKTTVLPVTAPSWLLVDAEGASLGHITSRIAHILRGKHKVSFSAHQMCGDHVIVINTAKLLIPGAKGRRKIYYKHTGHPGHVKKATLTQKMEEDSDDVVFDAVKGMLRNNRLRPLMLKRLHIFKDDKHTHAPQKPVPITL